VQVAEETGGWVLAHQELRRAPGAQAPVLGAQTLALGA
jgi:hypothetical protein